MIILTMVAPSHLALLAGLTICPLARTLILNLPSTSPLSSAIPQKSGNITAAVNGAVHCTTSPLWLAPAFPSFPSYEFMCEAAMEKAKRDLMSYDMDTEYEFLDRDATAQTTRPTIELPRKYVAGM